MSINAARNDPIIAERHTATRPASQMVARPTVLEHPNSARKLAAILSADIVGYSALMSADEEGTVRKLREVREAVLPIIERFGGRIIDPAGDGILSEFPSAVRAVESAAAVQTRMEALNVQSTPPMLFRIGVNVGDVIHEGDCIDSGPREEFVSLTRFMRRSETG